jgi:hypothetical protein
LLLEPLRPRFLAHVLVDAFAEFAGIRREIEPFGLLAEFDALNSTSHEAPLLDENSVVRVLRGALTESADRSPKPPELTVSLRRDFIKIPFAAALAAALNPAALPSNTQPALTLLNVSYDPTRELDVAKADKEQFADGGSFDQIYTRN